jgi:hypothetical protein
MSFNTTVPCHCHWQFLLDVPTTVLVVIKHTQGHIQQHGVGEG